MRIVLDQKEYTVFEQKAKEQKKTTRELGQEVISAYLKE